MNPTLNPFEKLLVDLVSAKVEFITVGGIACVMNGYIRATEDVDILIKKNKENIKKLVTFLSSYGEGYGSQLQDSDFEYEEGAVRLIEEFPLDIFVIMGGNRYEDLTKFVQTIDVAGYQIPFLNAEGLIQLKTNSVREKDKIDVLNLKKLNHS